MHMCTIIYLALSDSLECLALLLLICASNEWQQNEVTELFDEEVVICVENGDMLLSFYLRLLLV